MDPRKYNGAVFLGLNGIAVKSHGGTDAFGFANAIGVAVDMVRYNFISDLKNVITDIYNFSKKLVIIKVACYDAKAKLPNGENAHITVRNPMWWKGFFDSVSSEFEEISTLLICTTKEKKFLFFKPWPP